MPQLLTGCDLRGRMTHMKPDDATVATLTHAVVELVREEVQRVALSGRNWKLVLNGSASGDVRMIIEEHAEVARRCQQVNG